MLKKIIPIYLLFTSSLQAFVCPSNCNPCSEACNDLCGLLLGFEGLYWTACQDNLEYATDVGENGFLVGPGETHTLNYNWNCGIRGWFGIHCDGGEGRIVYTLIQNKAKGSKTANFNESLIALLIHPASFKTNALEAEGENKFEYQTLDMLFGNNLSFCCDRIWIRPFYGARAMKILQKLNVTYEGLDFDVPSRVKVRSTLLAGGINAGLDMQYHVSHCLNIYGGLGGSVLAGKIDANQKQFEVDTEITEVKLDDDLRTCVPGYQLSAGVCWHIHCHEYLDFVLTAGYEFSHWFHVPTARRFVDDVNHGVSESVTKGQLTLHGATLSMIFAF